MTKSTSTSAASSDSQFRSMDSAGMDTASSAETGDDPAVCSSFKPLFSCVSNPDADQNDADGENPERLLEDACQKGFETGLQQGCEEACSLSRATLRPGLGALVHSLNGFTAYRRDIENRASGDAVDLALTVVERILGTSASIENSDRQALATVIKQAIAELNRLRIYIHPDDLSELHTIASQEGIEWLDLSEAIIYTDETLEKGDMRIEEQTAQRSSLNARVLKTLSEMLR